MTTPLTLTPLGEGWTATTTLSLVAVQAGGVSRRIERAVVRFTHEVGGRAEAVFHRRLNGGPYRLASAMAWTVCTDPGCTPDRGFEHALTEPESISGAELGVLVTDVVALAL
jgi:hypothetical protein